MSKFLPIESLTQKIVRENLHYDPVTGILTWIKAKPRIHVGMQAGSLTPLGYIRITINGRRVMAHIVAWLYMTGELRVRGIDHRDTNGANNKWENLRIASAAQNAMNTKVRSDNALGVKSVQRKKDKNRTRPFYATITYDGRQRQLGYFATIEEAAESYRVAALKHFGEFARIK